MLSARVTAELNHETCVGTGWVKWQDACSRQGTQWGQRRVLHSEASTGVHEESDDA